MKRFTLPLEEKLEKKNRRRSSANIDTPFLGVELADSEDEVDSEAEKNFSSMYSLG